MANSKNAELKLELNAVDNVSAVLAATVKIIDEYGKTIQNVSQAASKNAKESADNAEKSGKKAKSAASSYTDFVVSALSSWQLLQNLIVKPFDTLLDSFKNVGFQMDRLKRQSRLGVETLGKLGFAAEQNGSSIEGVASAMASIESKIEDAGRGSSAAASELYSSCGKTFTELQKMTPEERFMAVANVIRSVSKEADKAKIAQKMFGSDELLPLLEQGEKGIRNLMQEEDELGAPWSEENLAASRALAQSINRISTAWNAMKGTFMMHMAKMTELLFEKIQKVILAFKKWMDENPLLVKGLAVLTAAAGSFAVTLGAVVPVIMGLKLLFASVIGTIGVFLSPWVLIPTLLAGCDAAFLYFNGTLGTVWNIVKNFASDALESLTWFFGDAINLVSQGNFAAAWQNLWAKIELIFIFAKQVLAEHWIGLWNWLITVTKEGTGGIGGWLNQMLEDVGASSDSFYEVWMAGWDAVQTGMIKFIFWLKDTWNDLTFYLNEKWNGCIQGITHMLNLGYGLATGKTDQQIREMNALADSEFNAKSKKNDMENRDKRADIEAKREIALNERKAVTQQAIRKHRETQDRKRKETEGRINALNSSIEATRQIAEAVVPDPNDPNDPDYVSGKDPASFLQQYQDGAKGTQNSFQAIFGMGQTTEQKQLAISTEIRDVLRMIAEGAI